MFLIYKLFLNITFLPISDIYSTGIYRNDFDLMLTFLMTIAFIILRSFTIINISIPEL